MTFVFDLGLSILKKLHVRFSATSAAMANQSWGHKFYRLISLVWVLFGLAYVGMCITSLAHLIIRGSCGANNVETIRLKVSQTQVKSTQLNSTQLSVGGSEKDLPDVHHLPYNFYFYVICGFVFFSLKRNYHRALFF